MVEFTWEEYRSFWKPWRRALILKVLGRNFHFKFIEPKITKLCNLEGGCELVDLDGGYMVARIYTGEDYLKVLNGGLWTVIGYYLTISKWHPNFDPSEVVNPTTLA